MRRLDAGAWTDCSPHHSGFVNLGELRLHYLDWGGRGATLLFLAGLGNTAHIFDDLAPRFTDRFRVLALTRRGHGQSDARETGYDTCTLVEDLRQFLDQHQIRQVDLIGHSFAGTELTRFAVCHPERVRSLIYLDAAYDYSDLPTILANHPLSFSPSDEDLASADSLRDYLRTLRNFGLEPNVWSAADEANMRETWTMGSNGRFRYRMAQEISGALWKGMVETHPDYKKVSVPALAFYVLWGQPPWLSFCRDEATRKKALLFYDDYNRWKREQIERFTKEVANGRLVEMPETDHYLFLHRPIRVMREIRAFLLSLDLGSERRPAHVHSRKNEPRSVPTSDTLARAALRPLRAPA